MHRIFVVLFLSILLLGCAIKSADVSAELDKQFSLKANQTASIDSEGLTIKFREISGDSRCPSDVVCVWAGEVTAKLELKKSTNEAPIQLILGAGADNRSEAEFDDYSIKLVSVDPYPKTTGSIQQSNYSVILSVSKK